MEEKRENGGDEARVRCMGRCHREVNGAEKRCEAWGRHEWCRNYMVNLSQGKPVFFEEK